MSNTKQKSAEASLLCDVYRNAKMGAESILDLLPKVKDEEFKIELSAELERYDEIAAEAEKMLEKMGEEPEEEGAFSRMMAKMGIKMNTIMDGTTSHMAQMISEGCIMGTTDLQKRLNENLEYGEAEKLARQLISFEEDTIKRMKSYL